MHQRDITLQQLPVRSKSYLYVLHTKKGLGGCVTYVVTLIYAGSTSHLDPGYVEFVFVSVLQATEFGYKLNS